MALIPTQLLDVSTGTAPTFAAAAAGDTAAVDPTSFLVVKNGSGASINLQFLLGVQQTGSFKFFFNIEALP